MSRPIRFTLPVPEETLVPKWPDLRKLMKVLQKKIFDRQHRASELPSFNEDQPVFVTTREGTDPVPGKVAQETRNRSSDIL